MCCREVIVTTSEFHSFSDDNQPETEPLGSSPVSGDTSHGSSNNEGSESDHWEDVMCEQSGTPSHSDDKLKAENPAHKVCLCCCVMTVSKQDFCCIKIELQHHSKLELKSFYFNNDTSECYNANNKLYYGTAISKRFI